MLWMRFHQSRSIVRVVVLWCTTAAAFVVVQPSLNRPAILLHMRFRRRQAAATVTTLDEKIRPVQQIEWEVFVDQPQPSSNQLTSPTTSATTTTTTPVDKLAGATLDAFVGLTAGSSTIRIVPVVFPQTMRNSKGPLVRCVAQPNNRRQSFDVSKVDSVDKVYRILTEHMGEAVDTKVCECLKWKYKGNGHLEAGEVDLAIDAYNQALTRSDDNDDVSRSLSSQEGVVLLMRAAAHLERAVAHKRELQDIVADLMGIVPPLSSLRVLFEQARGHPVLSPAIFRKVLSDTARQTQQFRKTQYQHGLYQYTLLQASQDAIRATELLPLYASSWKQAGEILSELWKLRESKQYYERAMELDPTLQLQPAIAQIGKRQELVDTARAYGWSEDTLRLALDVAR